jgi:hypothetical protein
MDYAVVDELGENTQRLHMHLIIFNAPFLSNEEWHEKVFKRGFVKAQTCYSSNIAHYLAKYFGKGIKQKESSLRSYSISKGLKTPTISYDASILPAIKSGYIIRETEYIENPYTHEPVQYQEWLPPS